MWGRRMLTQCMAGGGLHIVEQKEDYTVWDRRQVTQCGVEGQVTQCRAGGGFHIVWQEEGYTV